MKRCAALVLALSLIVVVCCPLAMAANYTDTRGHWAQSAIDRWSGYAVVNGYPDGSFQPNGSITRGEFATVVTNLLGLEYKADNIYSDIAATDWYADAVLRCTYAGIMNGDGANAYPRNNISREEAIVMLARAFKIDGDDEPIRDFPDGAQISAWARRQVYAMSNRRYVNGDDNGNLRPRSTITRAEAVTLLGNIVSAYIDSPGVYVIPDNLSGYIVVKGDGVEIKGDGDKTVVLVADEYTVTWGELNGDSDGGTLLTSWNNDNGDYSQLEDIAENAPYVNHDYDPPYEFTVMFYEQPGALYDIQKTQKGGSVMPKGNPERIGYIFAGWSANLTDIRSNITANAKWIAVSDYANLFALPAYYGTGDEEFSLPLRVSGNVNLCAFDLVLTYDADKLTFVKFENTDGDAMVNSAASDGKIYINYLSAANTDGEIAVCEMVFAAVNGFVGNADVAITIENAAAFDNDNALNTMITYDTLNATIRLVEKVIS